MHVQFVGKLHKKKHATTDESDNMRFK